MKKYLLLFAFIGASIMAFAQNDEVTLMVSSDGPTKDEAVKTALRSAIEQAYGTFVSATTEILNDELVKDEIITVTQGNIKNYNEVASYQQDDGRFFVTLQTTVSITKLVSYAQSKGAKTEFAGAAFAMNLKMKQLNKENEELVVKNMFDQMRKLLKNGFAHKIEIVRVLGDGTVNAKMTTTYTTEGLMIWELFDKTMRGLSLSDSELDEYDRVKIKTFIITVHITNSEIHQTAQYYLRSPISVELFEQFWNFTFVAEMFNIDIVTDVKTIPIKIVKSVTNRNEENLRRNNFSEYINHKPETDISKGKNIMPLYVCLSSTNEKINDAFRGDVCYYALSENLEYLNNGISTVDGDSNRLNFMHIWKVPINNPSKSGGYTAYNQLMGYYSNGVIFDVKAPAFNHTIKMKIPLEDLAKITFFEVRHRID